MDDPENSHIKNPSLGLSAGIVDSTLGVVLNTQSVMNKLAQESSLMSTQIKKPSTSTTHKDSALLANLRTKSSAQKILQLSTNQKFNTIDMANMKQEAELRRISDENLIVGTADQVPF
jgi:NH3-dependent NAD+ synthetase